jgi:hypothetical protein
MTSRSQEIALAITVAATLVAVPAASASTIPVGIGAFGGSTLTTFAGLADGTEVNGLIVDGIQFSYSAGSSQLVIDGGPGITNNVAPPNIVSIGNNTGVLTLLLPAFIDTFGYGYAILNNAAVANATSISVFDGATLLGSRSYDGSPDPDFAGGFAGIQSTDPFNRVEITFNSVAAPAFTLDNIRALSTDVSDVPEPATLMLLGTGVLGVFRARARRRKP